jgi:hypothetical protein
VTYKAQSPGKSANMTKPGAIFALISRKGPWHLSLTLATLTSMSKIPPGVMWGGEFKVSL